MPCVQVSAEARREHRTHRYTLSHLSRLTNHFFFITPKRLGDLLFKIFHVGAGQMAQWLGVDATLAKATIVASRTRVNSQVLVTTAPGHPTPLASLGVYTHCANKFTHRHTQAYNFTN